MKVYSIGRDQGCDIVMNDNTDVISRRHAILTVMSSGKMTIVDQSQNGTYVNGIRIASNVPVPVTRKDNISLAHVARLDWNRVPKTVTITQYAIIAVVAVLIVVAAIFGYDAIKNNNRAGNNGGMPQPTPPPAQVDSLNKKDKPAETGEKKPAEGEDNINKPKPDTTAVVTEPKPKPKPPKNDDKEKADTASSPKTLRPIQTKQ